MSEIDPDSVPTPEQREKILLFLQNEIGYNLHLNLADLTFREIARLFAFPVQTIIAVIE